MVFLLIVLFSLSNFSLLYWLFLGSFLILGMLQEVGCVATNWDMYDTYNSLENNQEGKFGLRVINRCDGSLT